jgi:hypothetical protein
MPTLLLVLTGWLSVSVVVAGGFAVLLTGAKLGDRGSLAPRTYEPIPAGVLPSPRTEAPSDVRV